MTYTNPVWVNNQAPALNATNLNNLGYAVQQAGVEIETLKTQVASPFNYKGVVADVASLPATGNTVNDTYYVTAETCLYSWNGSAWSQSSLEESDYLEEITDLKNALEQYEDIFTGDVDESVQNWLDVHPEATTTVLDGSLTESKFADALKLKAIKDYVTPQMFGAKGDGVTDDTGSLTSLYNYAFANDSNVFFPNGVYCISNTVYVTSKYYMPAGATIKATNSMEYVVKFPSENEISRTSPGICFINVDANKLANYGVGSGKTAKKTISIRVVNPIICGFNDNLVDNGNNENLINVYVACDADNHCDYGLIATSDNDYGEIITINCKYGVKTLTGTTNIHYIHSWLSSDILTAHYSKSACINAQGGHVSASYIYQDNMNYAIYSENRSAICVIGCLTMNNGNDQIFTTTPPEVFLFDGSTGVATVDVNNINRRTGENFRYTPQNNVRFFVGSYNNSNNTGFIKTNANELPDKGTYFMSSGGSGAPNTTNNWIISSLAGSYQGIQLAGNANELFYRAYRMDNRQFYEWHPLARPRFVGVSSWLTLTADSYVDATFTHNKGSALSYVNASVETQTPCTCVIYFKNDTTLTIRVYSLLGGAGSLRVHYSAY